jgi:hypothetical protein
MTEKEAPYALCFDVLKRLDKASILEDMTLVGSWCVYFYKQHYAKGETAFSLRTTDIDFLIPIPPKIRHPVDIQKLLADLGFRESFSSHGFIRLVHPEFTIDFLVPWRGRHEGKPYPIKNLGISATPLRFVDLLLSRQIHIRAEGLSLTLPHPACFAFQKLIISGRRQDANKQAKDRAQAFDVLDMVIHRGEQSIAKLVFQSLPPKWRKTILKEIKRGPSSPGSRIAELKAELTS